MSNSRKRKTKGGGQYREKPTQAPSNDELIENAELRYAYQRLSETLNAAQIRAEKRVSGMPGASANDFIDLTHAANLLDQYPQLGRYLQESQRRAALREEALATKSSPTGYPATAARGDLSPMGGWAGLGAGGFGSGAANMVGVHNARQLRDWVDRDEWINAGVNFLSQKVARSDVATLPSDERKSYNRNVLKSVDLILDQPNELRDTWPMLAGMFTRDLLTLGQAMFTKNMTPRRVPMGLYCEDAANVRIYSAWSGDPDEPRYLYQENAGLFGVGGGPSKATPLRNDEAIVVPWNPATYRFGWGPVQVLADTIQADLNATDAASHLVQFRSPPHLVDLQGATPLQINALRSSYENEVMGRREILFTGSPAGAKVYPLVFSAKDQQWLEWQVYLVRKICAVLQISPQDLGISFDINKSTAGAQLDISDSKGSLPILLLMEDYLNREFLADFAPHLPYGRSNLNALNLRVMFPEITEIARQRHAAEAVEMATKGLAGLPCMTINMVLAMMGQEPIPGGNTLYTFSPSLGTQRWLSYDDDLGSWVPPTGMQDPAGGPNADTSDIAADDTGDDNGDSSADNEAPGQSAGEAPGSTAPTAGAGEAAAGSAPASGGAAATATTASFVPPWQKDDAPGGGNHTGIMVAFFVDPETAKRLAIDGGEDPSDLHCTLAMLGDIRAMGSQGGDIGLLKQAIASCAARYQALNGCVGGIGRFAGETSDAPTPVYASVDMPGLVELRVDLVKSLAAAGWEAAANHGYTPHITLAYVDPSAPMPVASVPSLPLTFSQLVLAWGDERIAFPLGAAMTTGKAVAHQQRAPMPIIQRHDTRQPGRLWSVSGARRAGQPGTHSTSTGNHEDEGAARAALEAAVNRVFADVSARGHAAAERKH